MTSPLSIHLAQLSKPSAKIIGTLIARVLPSFHEGAGHRLPRRQLSNIGSPIQMYPCHKLVQVEKNSYKLSVS